jgi:hypothetical protein
VITRADEQPDGLVWSFGLDDEIPDTPLPLIAPGEYVPLAVQAALQTIYQARRFRTRLDYEQDPEPPLRDHERIFIQKQLAKAGLR